MNEWIYGRNPVYEALRAGRRQYFSLLVAQGSQEKGRLADILNLCRQKKIKINFVPRNKLSKLGDNNQGVVLEASRYIYHQLDEMFAVAKKSGRPPFFLILDTLQDPQNLGTLLRTAEAVGVHGIILPLRRTATITPAVVSSSSGASEHLLITQSNLAQTINILKQKNVWVIGLDGGPDSQPAKNINLKGSIALVVGSEGQGIRRLVRDSCDSLMSLPMFGKIESLNAAVAGSVGLYFVVQARGEQG